MTIHETIIPGCYEILPQILRDHRGVFVKTFQEETFLEHRLNTLWCEEYYSVSCQGVLRGLHFQLPPHDHEKLVYCTAGAVLDAVVDLRNGSPTYGCHIVVTLDAERGNMLYLPRGLAHGFYVTSKSATMMYKVSSAYAPDFDSGILWDSAGIHWPDNRPKLSERDAHFSTLEKFSSPFVYDDDGGTP